MPSGQRGTTLEEAATVPHLRPVSRLHPVPAWPLTAISCVVAILLTGLSSRYGYLSDEMYFLVAGKYYLDWGYMDQQPVVPLLAAGMDALAPGSLPVFRIPATLVTVLGVVLTALIAREFGGDRRTQILAAAAYPLAPWLLLSGHWLAAATMEPPQWALIIWLLVRWVRLHRVGIRRDRLLLALGAITTIAVQTKFQVAILCAALLISVLAFGPRALFRRPALWVAILFPLLTAIPTLWWQAAHGWPARRMGTVVDSESDRLLLLPTALAYSGVVVGAVLCCFGIWQLLRGPDFRDFRFLGWAFVGVTVFYLIVSGRANYFSSLYGPLFAAAMVGFQRARLRRTQPRSPWLVWPAYLLSMVLPLAMLPIYPTSWLAAHPEIPNASRLYETGWPELARTVSHAYRSLSPETQNRTAIVGGSYHLAGALDVHGRELGLPRAYSPHRGYWYFGRPPDEADVVLYVGPQNDLDRFFEARETVGRVQSDLENLAQGVWVVRYDGRTASWQEIWPTIRTQ